MTIEELLEYKNLIMDRHFEEFDTEKTEMLLKKWDRMLDLSIQLTDTKKSLEKVLEENNEK